MQKQTLEIQTLKANKVLLSHVFNLAKLNIQNNLRTALIKINEAVILERKRYLCRISLKQKGRIIKLAMKNGNRLTVHEAFLRWKIRADSTIVKKAIDQIILNSRLNRFNAFFKLKALLGDKENKMNLKKRKKVGFIGLIMFLQRKQYHLMNQALKCLSKDIEEKNKLRGILFLNILLKYHTRYLKDKFELWRLITKVSKDKHQKQLDVLKQLGIQYGLKNVLLTKQRIKEAFYKWLHNSQQQQQAQIQLKKIKQLIKCTNITNQLVKKSLVKLFNMSQHEKAIRFLNQLFLRLKNQTLLKSFKNIENLYIQQRMNEQFNNINKIELIKRLNQVFFKSQDSLLRQVLFKFYQKRLKNIKIQDKIQRKNNEQMALTLKEFQELLKDSYKNWKETQAKLELLNSQQSQSEKRKLAIQLFYQRQMNQINVAFVEWKYLAKQNKQQEFENENMRDERLKREAIILFKDYGHNRLRLYFRIWKMRAVKQDMIRIFNAIHKIIKLNKFTERALKKYVMEIWRGPKIIKNLWFQRVADMIAKTTKLNNQKAFWRMKHCALNYRAVSLTTLQIIKVKKLFNNLVKVYERIRQRAFTNIEHYGQGINDTSSFLPASQSSILQHTPQKDSFMLKSFDT